MFVLTLEVIIFGVVYLFGSHGMQQLSLMAQANADLQQEVTILKQHLEQLELQLKAWTQDNFYLEKKAREQLHMARPGEQIYHIS